MSPLSAATRLGPYEITAKLGEGGMIPRWRADGRELYFLTRPDRLMVAPQLFLEFCGGLRTTRIRCVRRIPGAPSSTT